MSITKTGVRVDTDPYFSNPLVFEEDGQVSSIAVTGLNPNTTYHVMGYVIEDGTKIFSESVKKFTTNPIDYFGIRNTSNGQNTITITKHEDPNRGQDVPALTNITLSYTKDNGATWNTWSSSNGNFTLVLESGETVKFKGNNTRNSTSTSEQYYNFGSTASCSISGDLNTIVSERGGDIQVPNLFFGSMFMNMQYMENDGVVLPTESYRVNYFRMFEGCSSLTTVPALPANGDFYISYSRMFKDCTSIVTVPNNLLPAVRVSNHLGYGQMFEGCTSLTNAPVLPSTVLSDNIYTSMFRGCTSLTQAPALPATTLMPYCYASMFEGCTSLTNAPELPATTLAANCYNYMFYGCTSLTTAPNMTITVLNQRCCYAMFLNCTSLNNISGISLQATIAAIDCYNNMFCGCTSLTTAPATLSLTTLAEQCCANMFTNCSSLTAAPALPATTLATRCYDAMFMNCTALTTSPELPATIINATECYAYMFNNCPSLNKIIVRATSWSTANATDWVNGVAATGDFHNLGEATIPSGVSGIPTGWREIKPLTYFNLTNEYAGQNTIRLVKQGSPDDITIEYSKDKQTWTTWNSSSGDLSITLDEGEKVYMRGNNSSICKSQANYYQMNFSQNMSANGTIMSFVDKTMETTTIPSTYCFCNFFYGNTYLTKAPELNATTLTEGAYLGMFQGCTGLTSAPELPAMSLAASCYANMFRSSGLTAGPVLPATTLAAHCYNYMFASCFRLVTGAEIYGANNVTGAFNYMFDGDSSLNSIITHGSTWNTGNSIYWMRGTRSGGSFYNLGRASIPTADISGIPSGWTEYTSL